MITAPVTDQRKHFTQMTPQEQAAVLSFVRSHSFRMAVGKHVASRIEMWKLDKQAIPRAIASGVLIEAHLNHAPDVCAVVRYTEGDTSVCVCLDLTNKEVVTAWLNKHDDNHRGLRYDQYKLKANLVDVISRLQ